MATTGSFTAGQSFDGGLWNVTQGTVAIDGGGQPHSGNNFVFLTPSDQNVIQGIAQTIATTAGQSYTLAFYAAANSTDNTFNVLFDNMTVAGSPTTIPDNGISATTDYTGYTFDVTALTNSSTLEFDASNPPAHTLLDDVSLTPNGLPPAAVPEPAPLALLGLGLPGLFLLARKRAAR